MAATRHVQGMQRRTVLVSLSLLGAAMALFVATTQASSQAASIDPVAPPTTPSPPPEPEVATTEPETGTTGPEDTGTKSTHRRKHGKSRTSTIPASSPTDPHVDAPPRPTPARQGRPDPVAEPHIDAPPRPPARQGRPDPVAETHVDAPPRPPARQGRPDPVSDPTPAPIPVSRPGQAPTAPLKPTPARTGRSEPAPEPTPARVGRVDPPAKPTPGRVGRIDPPPAKPAPGRVGRVDPPPPQPAPVPAKRPGKIHRVELVDISYEYGSGPLEEAQADAVYAAATEQFNKISEALVACDIDDIGSDVNLQCTTKDHYWQQFAGDMMWIGSDGKIGEYTGGCVREYLTGASMPIGKIMGGQWWVKYKILRTFKPNPEGGALCPYKGLAE